MDLKSDYQTVTHTDHLKADRTGDQNETHKDARLRHGFGDSRSGDWRGSSASADTFCLSATYEETCALGNRAAVGTELAAKLKEGKTVLTGALEVQCNNSTVNGKATENGGAVDKGSITSFTLTNCSSCTEITAKEFGVAGKWGVSVDWKKVEAGTQFDDLVITEPRIELQKCPLGIQCTASASALVLDVTSTGAQTTVKQ